MNGSVMTKEKSPRLRVLSFLLLALFFLLPGSAAKAADMPTAAGSPIAGITFDDRPLMLPIQRNFQMAMLTASSEMGRSCGRMEAYGWRMQNDEQQRVNQLFNNTVDRMRAQGYVVETKTSNAVSRDVTLFAADRPDRHLIFLWSAGEIGLVMVLCETSPPLSAISEPRLKNAEAVQPATMPSHLPLSQSIQAAAQPAGRAGSLTSSTKAAAAPKASSHGVQYTRTGKVVTEGFSPIGQWVGTYTCSQGTTGAALNITSLKGDQFEGTFRFYPTTKNPYVPSGKYAVFGEYDRDSMRILVNPGKWIQRPKDYYNTIMIGSFDPVGGTFSAYFQGITGCTSFEATMEGPSHEASDEAMPNLAKEKAVPSKAKTKPKAKAKPKTLAKPVAATSDSSSFDSVLAPIPLTDSATKPRSSAMEPPAGIAVGEPPKPGR